MTKTYNKLVRDRIPEIIASDGKTCTVEVLSDSRCLQMLDAKLTEELEEYQESKSLEELADLLEVLRAVAVFVTDTNMACWGVNKAGLGKLKGEALCLMADPEVAAAAKAAGTTRAAAAVERAAAAHPAAVFAVGNAPTALLKLRELMEGGFRPALVIGAPVGFVNVVESKRQIFGICAETGVPCIAAMGRKGGSNVAAAICNALIYTALDWVDPGKRDTARA